jgi:hypothetical protein
VHARIAQRTGRVLMSNGIPDDVMECPHCGAGDLEVAWDGELTNFLCRRCWSCWHLELGVVQRIDPTTCPHCPHQPECLWRRRSGLRDQPEAADAAR